MLSSTSSEREVDKEGEDEEAEADEVDGEEECDKKVEDGNESDVAAVEFGIIGNLLGASVVRLELFGCGVGVAGVVSESLMSLSSSIFILSSFS